MSSTSEKKVTLKSKTPKSPIAKKPKASKEAKPKSSKSSSPSHPPYFQMIKEAILALHERTGSSPRAIAKYMEEKYKGDLSANFRKILSIQLKNLVAGGKLLKVKASFKLSDSAKQGEKKAVKDVKPKVASKVNKPKTSVKVVKAKSAPASALGKRKAVANDKSVKKATPVKKAKKAVIVKAKQPKSIRSPVAKRARKAVV